jgi:chromosome transmission fidelity protein 4
MEQVTSQPTIANVMGTGMIPILNAAEAIHTPLSELNLMNHFKVEVHPGKAIVDISVRPSLTWWMLMLACNMIGHVWTVDQDTHNTVTCEFYDREAHHQFFFTDPYLYDKACLSTLSTGLG